MNNIVYIAQSIDDFIATKDGGVDWLNDFADPDGGDNGFGEFMKNIDGLLIGKNTFEKVLSFGVWPYEKLVFVLSNSLKDVPNDLQDKAKIVTGALQTIIKNLNDQGYKNIYIDGGQLIQNALKEDLIDELIITTVPIILGDGIPLFGRLGKSIKLEYKRSHIFENGLVTNYYKRLKKNQ